MINVCFDRDIASGARPEVTELRSWGAQVTHLCSTMVAAMGTAQECPKAEKAYRSSHCAAIHMKTQRCERQGHGNQAPDSLTEAANNRARETGITGQARQE